MGRAKAKVELGKQEKEDVEGRACLVLGIFVSFVSFVV
jgi:hypothetical protein